MLKNACNNEGAKYRPSNGSEGEYFFEKWCSNCWRDRPMSTGVDFDRCEADECCEIIARSFAYNVDDAEYPIEWCWMNGEPTCTAFLDICKTCPPEPDTQSGHLF